MGKVLIVSKADRLSEYKKISDKYNLGFEINDFFIPDILDDDMKIEQIIASYKKEGLPEYCTLHGAFFDVVPFSSDAKIKEISIKRMEQSLDIAKKLGVEGVIFHTNYMPYLESGFYDDQVVNGMTSCIKELLQKYDNISIYLENMFDSDPHILKRIANNLRYVDNFGICLDYAHASISPTPVSDWVCELAPFIKHLHINDNDLVKDLHHPVGSGKIDWDAFKKYYDEKLYNCSVLIETTEPANQEKSVEYMKNKLNWDFGRI